MEEQYCLRIPLFLYLAQELFMVSPAVPVLSACTDVVKLTVVGRVPKACYIIGAHYVSMHNYA